MCAVLADRILLRRVMRRLPICLGVIVGLKSIASGFQAIFPPLSYRKDFFQDYLLARALISGENPYAPLPELMQKFTPEAPLAYFPHPSPHAPAGVLLTAPLGLISYDQAALIWFVFELCLLLAAASFVRRRFSLLSPGCCGLMLFTIFLAGAMPVSRSYISGQFSIAILFLSCLLYRSWLAGDSRGIGIWTGLALALKMFGWPIVFFLLIRRNWRALSTVFIVLVCSHILSWLLIGKDGLKSYYGEAVPAVIQSYRADGANLSLFGFGQRFFGGLRPPVRVDIAVPPLIDLPEAAPYAGAGIAAIVLFWVMLTCLKANRPETGPALLIALSAVFSPVVWLHGLSVMLIPLSVAFMFLQGLSFPSRHTAACAVLVFLFYCGDLFSKLLPGDGEPVSFALSLITLLPTVLVLVLMKYLAQLDAACGRKAASVQG